MRLKGSLVLLVTHAKRTPDIVVRGHSRTLWARSVVVDKGASEAAQLRAKVGMSDRLRGGRSGVGEYTGQSSTVYSGKVREKKGEGVR